MKIMDSIIAPSNQSFAKSLYLFTSVSIMKCVLSGAVSDPMAEVVASYERHPIRYRCIEALSNCCIQLRHGLG